MERKKKERGVQAAPEKECRKKGGAAPTSGSEKTAEEKALY